MGNHRMFSNEILDSDLFLDMPHSTQMLYIQLGMKADDDGFIGNPKAITRHAKCNEDDLRLLITKGFIMPFDSGVIVVRHWHVNNKIRSDRKKETIFFEEKAKLEKKINGEYILIDPKNQSIEKLNG